jgi:uncharacterized protein YfkK (UPF0435 family)
MCTTITLNERSVDLLMDALQIKIGKINSKIIINSVKGINSDELAKERSECNSILDALIKAKENFKVAETMAAEK